MKFQAAVELEITLPSSRMSLAVVAESARAEAGHLNTMQCDDNEL